MLNISSQNHPILNFQLRDQELKMKNDNLKLKAQFSFGKCKVCKDKATGIHYGIASCEGCKVNILLINNF